MAVEKLTATAFEAGLLEQVFPKELSFSATSSFFPLLLYLFLLF